MASSNTKAIAYGLGFLGLLTVAYAVAGPSSGTPNAGLQQVGPGGYINYGGGQWQNTTGNPVWLNATGMIINAAGTVMGNIADIIAALNQGGGGAGQGQGGGGGQGQGQGVGAAGLYYNPSPSALM